MLTPTASTEPTLRCASTLSSTVVLDAVDSPDPLPPAAQNLVEKITRMKIYSSMYWKEHCFALTAESLVDKAVDIKYAGGTYGGQVALEQYCMLRAAQNVPSNADLLVMPAMQRAPTQFMCLVLKLLQLQPDKEIIVEFIKNEDYKYVRVLGAGWLLVLPAPGSPAPAHHMPGRAHPMPNHRRILPAPGGQAGGGVPVPGAAVQRLPQSAPAHSPRAPLR